MITYNDLYEALRKEKYSEVLQPLGRKFVEDAAEYFNEKKEVSEKKEDMFSDTIMKTKKQLENAVAIFKELMTRRKKKMLTLAFIAGETGISKRDFDNMLDFEREVFDKIVKSMESGDEALNSLINGKREKLLNSLVSFKENVEEFLGMNGEAIGPFEKGEIANLPEEIAKILVEGGKAEAMDE